MCWHLDGKQFATTHRDGLVCIWTADEPQNPPVIRKFYGSFSHYNIDNDNKLYTHIHSLTH